MLQGHPWAQADAEDPVCSANTRHCKASHCLSGRVQPFDCPADQPKEPSRQAEKTLGWKAPRGRIAAYPSSVTDASTAATASVPAAPGTIRCDSWSSRFAV